MTRRSPLHEEHVGLGAKLTEFGGWEMPLQYRGVIAEHTAVRERAGLFDVSHLGKLSLAGEGAEGALDVLLPGKVAALKDHRASYNLVLTDGGGILDDIYVYRRPDRFLLVPNAANTDAVMNAIASSVPPGIEVVDERDRWGILALQGPASREIAGDLLPGANDLRLHSFADFELAGVTIQVARTGYTGEFGFELFVPWDKALQVWRAILSSGVTHGLVPAGLGSRDTLRLEMGYPLHGNDISSDTNPVEAGMEWLIDWSKPFRARDLLEKIRVEGPARKLAGLVAHGREIPRSHQRVLSGAEQVGEVTSGNFSPVLRKGIALAYIATEYSAPGTMLEVDVRGRSLPVEVMQPPFIKRR